MNKKRLPLVSIIIPVFNSESYVKDAISSVIDQTFKDIEIIVIDDGSTDKSLEIISGFKGIKLIKSETNRGVSHTRNRGIRESRGEYIAFLDSDDFWINEKLDKQIKILLKNRSIEGIYGKFKNFFENGVIIPEYISKQMFLRPEFGKVKNIGTLLTERKVFEKIGMFNESIRSGEDLDWFIRANDSGVNFKFVPEILMHRRLHGSNLSYDSFDNKKYLLEIFQNSINRKRTIKK
ncbi:MAG: glycosyltransferase [Acidobacteriota bacterium]